MTEARRQKTGKIMCAGCGAYIEEQSLCPGCYGHLVRRGGWESSVRLKKQDDAVDKTIIKRFLEARFDEFQEFIDGEFELEPTEAERIIDSLEDDKEA